MVGCNRRADRLCRTRGPTRPCFKRWNADQLRGALDHARTNRLPHPSCIWRRSRAEFERRLEGASYEEIARAGGGILSTVAATRAANEERLIAQALPRLDALIAEGCTTIEIKSGYGLDREQECKMLRAARALARRREVTISTTFLGAHALPPEAEGDRESYIDLVCDTMIPRSRAKVWRMRSMRFAKASRFRRRRSRACSGPRRPMAARQAACRSACRICSGAALAARHGALSADHLEYADEAGVAAMAQAGTVAVLLPGAFYFLRETQLPPVDALRRHNVPIALATDCNPGTSPLTSLLLAMNMAATLFRLTVEECLAGVTRDAARALGLARGDWDAGSRQTLRPRHLGHRRSRRARLPHGVQSAAPPGLEGTMNAPDWLIVVRGTEPLIVSDTTCGRQILQDCRRAISLAMTLVRDDTDWYRRRSFTISRSELGITIVWTRTVAHGRSTSIAIRPEHHSIPARPPRDSVRRATFAACRSIWTARVRPKPKFARRDDAYIGPITRARSRDRAAANGAMAGWFCGTRIRSARAFRAFSRATAPFEFRHQ